MPNSYNLRFLLTGLSKYWTLIITSSMIVGLFEPGLAQITPDETLGSERSRVTRDVSVRRRRGDRIDGGASRGRNLFHSFSEFNVDEAQRVYFANPRGIENILSRVTGDDISDIMGTLGVDGNANLFFLNPNGIIFGDNATLDIRGSFVATTADAFEFADGSTFSAANPDASPLLTVALTPGLQYGQSIEAQQDASLLIDSRDISSSGNLTVGENLTLAGDSLNLTGQLQAGGNLNLRARDTVQIRDSETVPFIASAGRHLRIQGNEAVDIFALSHPESGLISGRNLVLRSDAPVAGDAHFYSGDEFRIERLNGRRGRFISPNDPIIRSSGDVSFREYEGASLHIFAGGSVIIPGPITITGADTVSNSIQENVTLSDGETIVEIDGSAEPTLDIRAGVNNPGAPPGGTVTTADIQLGDISNPGGTVFLTNQYQPNRGLSGGDIEVGAIDTSVVRSTAGTARGGDVVIDGRGDIETTGAMTTFAHAGEIDNNFGSVITSPGNNVRAIGGHITLFSGNNITTQMLDSSAVAAAEGEETRTSLPNGTELLQRGDARATSRGGDVTLATRIDTSGQSVKTSIGNIEIRNINTSGQSATDTSANASVSDGINDAGFAIAGNATSQSFGGEITLSTDVTTGDITAESDIGTLRAQSIYSYAFADANAFNGGDGETTTGGTIDLVSRGGAITLSTDISSGDIASESDIGTLRTQSIYSYAFGYAFGDNSGNGEMTTGGTIDLVSRGGAITLSTNISSGDIAAESDIGTLRTQSINSYAFADANAINDGDGETTTGGTIDLVSRGGAITLSTDISSGDIAAESDIGTLRTQSIYSYAYTYVFGDNSGDGGTATGGIFDLVTQGGAIALSIDISSGDITTESDIGKLRTDSINSSAFVGDAFADANNRGGGETTIGGTIDLVSRGGAIALSIDISSGDITAESDIGILRTDSIDSFAEADSSAYGTNSDDGGTATGGAVDLVIQGGVISLSTDINSGDITAESDIGTLRTDSIDSSAYTYTSSGADNSGDGGIATGGAVDLVIQGGVISLSTDINSGDITAESDIGTLRTQSIDSYTEAGVFAYAFGDNSGDGGTATGGTVDLVIQGGAIDLSTDITSGDITAESDIGTLKTGSINSSAEAEAFAEAFADAVGDNSGDGGIATGGTIDLFAQGGAITLSTDISSGDIAAESDIGTLRTDSIYSFASAFATGAAYAEVLTVPGGNRGEEGKANGGSTTAVSSGGDVTFTTAILADTTVDEFIQGIIQINSTVTSSARALADSFAEGDSDKTQPGITRFESNGGDIRIGASGPIQFGENGILNASAGIFSQSFTQPETNTDNAKLEGGDITLSATDSILLNQINAETNSEFEVTIDEELITIDTDTLASSAGQLNVRTPFRIILRDNAEVSVSATGGDGEAGDMRFFSRLLSLGAFSRILSETDSGAGGNITIDLSDILNMQNGSRISSSAEDGIAGNIEISSQRAILAPRSRLISETRSGEGGNITIDLSDVLNMQNRSSISSSALRDGRSGDIDLMAQTAVFGPQSILTSEVRSGEGGNITIDLINVLQMQDESLISSSAEDGIAGNIRISSRRANLDPRSSLISEAISGEGGNITIELRNELQMQDSSSISSSAEDGIAGDIEISSRRAILGSRSNLISETESGDGGNIRLNLQDVLQMENGSRISTNAGTASSGGDGGNILIAVSNGFILAEDASSNSDITANAFEGSGGRVEILTLSLFELLNRIPDSTLQALQKLDASSVDPSNLVRGIFGLITRSRSELEDTLSTRDPGQLDPAQLPSNDITAISQVNPEFSGNIIVRDPDVDPTQGVDELPSALVDASSLIAPSCEARPRSESDFTVIGRGGVAPTTNNPISNTSFLDDLGPSGRLSSIEVLSDVSREESPPIIEAHGWETTADGQIILVAHTTNQSESNIQRSPFDCRMLSNIAP